MVLPFGSAADAAAVSLLIALIRTYQRFVPRAAKRSCLLEPHCSEYAVLALRKYGFPRGLTRSLQRIARCKPGLDAWEDYP
jgi:putative membrane protein insertion efficiency factor